MKNLMAIVLILVSAGLFYVFIGPTYEEIQTQLALKAQYDDALNNSQKVLGLRNDLLNKYNGFSPSNLSRLNTLLPDYVDNVRLIIELEGIANQYGLRLKNVTLPTSVAPTPRATSGSTGGGAAATVLSVPEPTSLGVSSLTFTVSTSYDNYQAFLQGLEGSLRMLDITSIGFKAPEKGVGNFDVTTSFDTYFYKR